MYKYLFIYIFWTGYGVHSLMEEEEEGKDAQYKFEYSVRDSKTGNYQSREEELLGDKLRGQYSLHDPDGYKRTVVYKVDGPSGFVAKVHREKISTCPHCKDSSEPFAAGYEISHHSPDSYVNSYFYMGSGLSSSVVSLGKDGVRVFTKTRHLHS